MYFYLGTTKGSCASPYWRIKERKQNKEQIFNNLAM